MKRIKRGTIPKIGACLIAVALVFAIVTSITYAADEKYEKDYEIKNVLSDYQYVISGDANIGNHAVGGMVIGGAAKVSSFGDGAVAPSYFRNLISYGNYSGSQYLERTGNYKGYNDIPAFYKKANYSGGDLTKYEGDGDFFDFEQAFTMIQGESEERANSGRELKMDDLKKVEMDHYLKGRLLIIPFDLEKNITVPKKVWDAADFVLLDGVQDYSDFVDKEYTINILADEVKMGGDYEYSNPGDDKKWILMGARPGTSNARKFEDEDGETIYGLNTEQGNGLQKASLEGSIQDGQMNLKGMKLLWNMPKAEDVTTNYLPGHVVAAKADVDIKGGNFEGSYVAKTLKTSGEGHFYPYEEVPKEKETPKPEKTPKVTEKPTPKPTPEVTKKPTPKPTPEVTEEPTPEPTPEITEEPTPEPTPEVTEEPTPIPTPEVTEEPTPEPTPEITEEPTPEPTPEVTEEPTPEPTPEITEEPTPEPTPEVTEEPTPEPTSTPGFVGPTPLPTTTPEVTEGPTPTPEETEPPAEPTPEPTSTPGFVGPTPLPTTTPEVTEGPTPTPEETEPPAELTPEPTSTPGFVGPTPLPTTTPDVEEPTPTPAVTEEPTPEPTSEVTEEPTPTPEETVKPTKTLTPENTPPAPIETETPDVEETPEPTAEVTVPPVVTMPPEETVPPTETDTPEETVTTPPEASATPLTTLEEPTPPAAGSSENPAETPGTTGTTVIKKDEPKPTMTTVLDEDTPLAKASPEKKVKKKSKSTTILDEDVPLSDSAPETGDTTNLFIPIMGLGLSIVALGGTLLYRRKRD